MPHLRPIKIKTISNMKQLIQFLSIALLATAFFTNCKNSTNPSTEATVVDSMAAYEPIVAGYWMNKAWWETLQKTKSPHEAAKHLGLAGVTVDKDSTGAWTAVVNYAFHEGMIYKLQPAEGGNFALINTDDNNSVAHEFKFNADKTVFLDSFEMVRIGDANMDDADLSAGIVSGTYSLKGKPGDVTFSSNGSISGLEGYDRYDVLFDYIEDQLQADEIMLIKPNTDGDRDFYVFEIKGNQLLLSTIEEKMNKDSSTVYSKGKVKYELTKK